VVFLDTGWSFPETLQYKEELIEHLGLTNVRDQRPDSAQLAAEDPDNTLWQHDPDRCCFLRKVLPLEQVLAGFDAWVTGIKRGQTAHRARTPRIGAQGRLIKLCPLADWDAARVQEFMHEHRLPQHPLLAQGYASVGCVPCTAPVTPGAHARTGRWAGKGKTECGIHLVHFQRNSSEQRPLPFAQVSESAL
jgi:phosphoadenosine phosphosulfate reductase